MSDAVLYTQTDGIGRLSLNRPEKLNAMSHEMGAAIRTLVQQLNADASLRCVIVRGEGRAFSAGGDLAMLEHNMGQSRAANQDEMLDFYTKFLAVRELAVPTIALLQGRATGAGLCFALGCDMRLAADDALLSVNFVRLGLTPGMAGTWSLQRLIGLARATELLVSGRTVTGVEAATMGLVNACCAPHELESQGLALAQQIAGAGPQAVRATKRLLREAAGMTLADALETEAEAQARCFESPELREGLAAVRERRTPEFGR